MSQLAPGVPPDYYASIYAVEEDHWWHRGMRRITATLLGERLRRPGLRLLDAGCGTGGFLRFALDDGSLERAAGVDISSAGIELARTRVPEADLHVAPVWEVPFEDRTFDLIVMNDVLQHLPEDRVGATFEELRRLQAPDGALLVRTGGALRHRRERDDWRAYDRRTLAGTIEGGGFRCLRVTYVNMLPSLWALARGRRPHAPTEERHGVSRAAAPGLQSSLASRWLDVEARALDRSGLSLPYGHTLLALAAPAA